MGEEEHGIFNLGLCTPPGLQNLMSCLELLKPKSAERAPTCSNRLGSVAYCRYTPYRCM